MNLRIGRIVNIFPQLSHQFLCHEIAAPPRQGLTFHRFAMRDGAAAPVSRAGPVCMVTAAQTAMKHAARQRALARRDVNPSAKVPAHLFAGCAN